MLTLRVLPRRGARMRSALATLEIMTLLVAAHSWAGGERPHPGWIVATAALVFGAGTVVLRRRTALRVVVPALALVQFLLHCWLAVLAPSGAHAHGGHLELTWQMVLAHVVGALVTALVWELRRRAVDVVLHWSDVGPVPVPALRQAAAHDAPVLPLRRPLVVVPLRGPPVGLAA